MTALTRPFNIPMDFPVLDEKMDMTSSPFHQVEVEDLDLEFDQMENQHLIPPSDNLMDDASEPESKLGGSMQGDHVELLEDQNMQDDEQDGTASVEKDLDMDEETPDDQEQEDEILYDEDDEEDDTTVADTVAQQANNQPELDNPEEDLFDFDDTDNIDISTVEQQHGPETVMEKNKVLAIAQLQNGDYVATDDRRLSEKSPSATDQQTLREYTQPPQVSAPETLNQQAGGDDELQAFEDNADEQAPSDVPSIPFQAQHANIEDAGLPGEEAQAEPEAATSIDISNLAPHFVTLKYNGVEYPLFSDEEQAAENIFPLSDTSLIFEPLDKLLEACRERVFNPDEDHLDEVILEVPAFDLCYRQDSKYTSQRSLADILQVYVMLKQNENADFVPPLNCTLVARTCLATQYNWLVEEAGKQTPYKWFHTTYIEHNIAPTEGDPQALEVHTETGSGVAGESGVTEHHDFVEAELEAEAAGVASGEAFEHTSLQIDDTDAQEHLDEPTQLSVSGANKGLPAEGEGAGETQADAPDTSSAHIADENGQQTGQTSDFFEDAFEDKDHANEAEDAEEALEQEEDQKALKEVQERYESGAGHDSYEQVEEVEAEEEEQLDFGDVPEPFKQIEEEREIALEEEDLFIYPDDPLEVSEDPDALLEGRADEAALVAEDPKPVPVNGSHAINVLASAPQPTTPGKARPSKRKVDEDEDDLLELDFNTPEPKRHRPSPH